MSPWSRGYACGGNEERIGPPGKAARISRLAIGPSVHGAWEAVAGLTVGALVQYTNGLPIDERSIGSDAVEEPLRQRHRGRAWPSRHRRFARLDHGGDSGGCRRSGGGRSAVSGGAPGPVRDRGQSPSTHRASRACLFRRRCSASTEANGSGRRDRHKPGCLRRRPGRGRKTEPSVRGEADPGTASTPHGGLLPKSLWQGTARSQK